MIGFLACSDRDEETPGVGMRLLGQADESDTSLSGGVSKTSDNLENILLSGFLTPTLSAQTCAKKCFPMLNLITSALPFVREAILNLFEIYI